MTNRLLGLFFAAFGLVLLFWVIPAQTEVIQSGWMRPRTLPNVTAALIAIAGVMLAVRPRGAVAFEWRSAGRAALYLSVVAAGLWLIDLFGFELVGPPMALAMMLLIGERRPFWLVVGAVGVPLALWLVVPVLLDRPLP